MQKNYVFSEKDLLPFEFVTSQWNKLQEVLNDMEKGKQICKVRKRRKTVWHSEGRTVKSLPEAEHGFITAYLV